MNDQEALYIIAKRYFVDDDLFREFTHVHKLNVNALSYQESIDMYYKNKALLQGQGIVR